MTFHDVWLPLGHLRIENTKTNPWFFFRMAISTTQIHWLYFDCSRVANLHTVEIGALMSIGKYNDLTIHLSSQGINAATFRSGLLSDVDQDTYLMVNRPSTWWIGKDTHKMVEWDTNLLVKGLKAYVSSLHSEIEILLLNSGGFCPTLWATP